MTAFQRTRILKGWNRRIAAARLGVSINTLVALERRPWAAKAETMVKALLLYDEGIGYLSPRVRKQLKGVMKP